MQAKIKVHKGKRNRFMTSHPFFDFSKRKKADKANDMEQRNAGACWCGADIRNHQTNAETNQRKKYAAKDDSAEAAKGLHGRKCWNYQ